MTTLDLSRRLTLSVFAFCVSSCASAPQSTEPSKQASVDYARSTAFVMGAEPYAYGDEDPLNVYGDVPGYAGLWLHSPVQIVRGNDGVDVLQPAPSRLVILTTSNELEQSWVDRIRADACRSPTVCEADTTVATVKYSLRDLRSVAGWLLRSPAGAFVVPREKVETGTWNLVLSIEATETAEPIVREMMETAAIPSAAYQLRIGRPYNP